jgi:hypothetical protein
MQSKNIFILGAGFLATYFFLPNIGYELQSPITKVSKTTTPISETSKFRTLQTSFSNMYDIEEHIIKKESSRIHLFHGKKIESAKVVEKINQDEAVNDMTYK